MSRTTGCLLAACAWLAIVATASSATAQELDEPEDPLRADTTDVVQVDADEGVGFDRTVEQWIFGGQGADGDPQADRGGARRRTSSGSTRSMGSQPPRRRSWSWPAATT